MSGSLRCVLKPRVFRHYIRLLFVCLVVGILSFAPLNLYAQPAEMQKIVGFGMGMSAAIEGDLVCVGSSGAVQYYQRHNGVWQRKQLIIPQVASFGSSLALSGDTLVIGAPQDDHSGLTDAGSAYVFVRDAQTNQWIEVQKLVAPDPGNQARFGTAVAVHGDLIAIGAEWGNNFSGAAYVFERIGAQWQLGGELIMPGQQPGDEFGRAVAISETGLIMVGVPFDDYEDSIDAGSVQVFRKQSGLWLQIQSIEETDPRDDEWFGYRVVVEGGVLAVSAPQDNSMGGGVSALGSVSIFQLQNNQWSLWERIQGESSDSFFGRAIALGDGVVAASADLHDEFGDELDEMVFIYRLEGGNWVQSEVIRPIDRPDFPARGQRFGWSCALDGTMLLVGAPEDDELGTNAGAAYVFDLTGQSGTRAILTDVAVAFGTPISVGLIHLKTSEDARARIRSQFGFSAIEPNVADLRIGAQNYVENPTLLNLLIEARITQPGGTMRVRLHNWNTSSFNQVRRYTIGTNETVRQVVGIPSSNYIRTSDSRVELSLRASVVATFSALGFEEQTDFVNILVN